MRRLALSSRFNLSELDHKKKKSQTYPMRVILALTYLFSMWMVVDAYRRGAQQFWYAIILLPLGAVIYFFMVKIDDYEWSHLILMPGSDLKCASCRFCGALYEDRVRCCSGKDSVMKTRVHISYCVDYQARQKR